MILKTVTERDFHFTKQAGGDATWVTLGTIDGEGIAKRYSLSMTGFRSKDIILRFTSHGAQDIPPEIDRFEIEYMPVGPKFRSYMATVIAVDDIILEDMTREQNGAMIQATLFSCAESMLRYVVAFPFPAPVGHTQWVQVTVRDPGAMAPVLAYQDENGNALNVIGGEIPLQFDVL